MDQPEIEKLLKISQFDFINVLLTGETGTGKTYYANLVHQNGSRKYKPFVAVNCASIPKDLIEAELFGAERGSFTGATSTIIGKFEAAHGGTMFLDEIGEMDLNLQSKLLTVLEDKTIKRLGSNKSIKLDVRFIFATNQPLSVFRDDFRYRITGFQFEIKPLRERKDKIPGLAQIFLSELNQNHNLNLHFSPCILEFLEIQGWYGNLRELKNFVNLLYVTALIKNLKFINTRLLDDLQIEFTKPTNLKQILVETIPQILSDNSKVPWKRKEFILSKKEAQALELYRAGELKVWEILARTNVKRTTFYRKLHALNEDEMVFV